MLNDHFLCLHLPMWAKAGFRVMKDHRSALVCFFVSQIKQIDSRNHRIHQNVARKSVTNCAIASCVTDLLLPHFEVIYDLTEQMHGIIESVW